MLKRRPFSELASCMRFDSDYNRTKYSSFGFFKDSLGNSYYVWQSLATKDSAVSFIVTYTDFIEEFTVVAEYFFFISENESYIDYHFIHKRASIVLTIDLSRVRKDFRGRGITYLFYKYLVKKGIVLISGDSQTIYARKLWLRLSKDIEVYSYVVDLEVDQKENDVIRVLKRTEIKNYNSRILWNSNECRRVMLVDRPLLAKKVT